MEIGEAKNNNKKKTKYISHDTFQIYIGHDFCVFFFWKKQWMIHLDEAVGIREGGTAQCHGH